MRWLLFVKSLLSCNCYCTHFLLWIYIIANFSISVTLIIYASLLYSCFYSIFLKPKLVLYTLWTIPNGRLVLVWTDDGTSVKGRKDYGIFNLKMAASCWYFCVQCTATTAVCSILVDSTISCVCLEEVSN